MALRRTILDIEMEDGIVHTGIKTNIADQMLYAKKAKMEKWASAADDPITFVNFLAWAALHRLGKYDKGFNEFIQEAGAVELAADGGSEDIDPTTAVR